MQHNTDESSLFLETNQHRDTFIRTQPADNVTVRLFSMRSQEARTQTLLNQDFACLASQPDASSLCFCVCDGVGSSYRGDFAAHYLAGHLLSWLQEMPAVSSNQDQLASTLHGQLDTWAHDAHSMLSKLAIPAETPELVREVLQELRDTAGSETVFLCGRIDTTKSSAQRATLPSTHAIFCWMGNITAHLSLAPHHSIILGDHFNDKNRWSTIHSRRGQVSIWSESLSTIEHLIIYTDGFAAVGTQLALSTDEEWQAHAQRLLLLPQNDDMTALEFCWLHEKKGPAA